MFENIYSKEDSFLEINATDFQTLEMEFHRYGLKPLSVSVYARAVQKFLVWANMDLEKFRSLPIEKIEDLTEDYINEHRNKISPKYLNGVYSSVKAACHRFRMIKSRKMFREVKFDKSSRSTYDPAMFGKDFIKRLCDNADLLDKLVIVLYGLYAVRPSLIPQLKVADILETDIAILPSGEIKLAEKTWIWVKRSYEGNKANIDFPVILSSETSRWLEQYLNERVRIGEKLTPQTALLPIKSRGNLNKMLRHHFKRLNYGGRSYLLRHFGSKILKLAVGDEDFKEWLCGHKGKIAAIYDHEGHTLAPWEIENYKKMVNEKELTVYGLSETAEAQIQVRREAIKALLLNLNDAEIKELIMKIKSGQINTEEFNTTFNEIARKAMDEAIENKFQKMWLKMAEKHNGNSD